MATFLWQVGGGEVHREMLVGKAEADGMECVADAFTAFGDGFVGEADDVESQVTRRNAHLHFDRAGFHAHERQSRNLTVHAPLPTPSWGE
jgi:hypothetical protein